MTDNIAPGGTGNLFDNGGPPSSKERFETLLHPSNFRLERIISTGQATPRGEWLEQPRQEWVVLLSGAAKLRFESPDEEIEMRPGDWKLIPANCRHRVEWTDGSSATVWLALHF